jgi:hypothetical protein
MSQTGSSAWWADVQHLRGAAERTDEARRRADRADLAARRASRERRSIDDEVATVSARTAQRRRIEPDAPVPRRPDRVDLGAPVPRRADGIDLDAPLPRRPGPDDRVDLDAPLPRRPDRIDLDVPLPRRPDRIDLAAVPDRGGYGPDAAALSGRRTVEIRGRTVPAPAVPRSLDLDRRRPPRRVIERVGPRPDRLALWALLLGLVLILVAVGTSDAATVASVAGR